MYFTNSSLQVTIFKDLVTLADPTSAFSFVSYLHEKGKIYHFLNAQFESVPRREFRNYLEWASDRNENINFGEAVLNVGFDGHFVVETEKRMVRAQNIAVGVGTEPDIPAFAHAHLGPTHIHVSEFGDKAKSLEYKSVAIIGGGQSGAEAFLDAISQPRKRAPSHITWISRRENFCPLDDSSFTNDYFTPSHSEFFFEQDLQFRKSFIEKNIAASDGISERTIRNIYQRLYTMMFIEERPEVATLMPGRRVDSVRHDGRQWVLHMVHTVSNSEEIVYADVVIWASGFRGARMGFLDALSSRLDYEEDEVRINENFAAVWDGPTDRRIFMLNAARRQRGLPERNLSLMAWRSQRVLEMLQGGRADRGVQAAPFLTWPAMVPPWRYSRKPYEGTGNG